MCGGPETPPPIKSAKCASIAPMVFGIINILAIFNVGTGGGTSVASAGEFFGGVCLTIAASMLLCCVAATDDEQTRTAAAGKANCAKILAFVSVGFFLIGVIGFIVVLAQSLQCLSIDCDAYAAAVPSTTAGCDLDVCEEKWDDSGWDEDWDCIASPQYGAQCSDGSTLYISENPTYAWEEGGEMICLHNSCCSTASSAPEGFVDSANADEYCEEDTAWYSVICAWQEICYFGVYAGAIGIVWCLIDVAIALCMACKLKQLAPQLKELAEGGGPTYAAGGAVPMATATAMPAATAVPMATATAVPVKGGAPDI